MTRPIIPDFSRARLLVVGDLMLDRYWSGAVRRISPEAPVPVVNVDATEERVGGAGNVALNIATLGARVTALGLVGNDPAAHTLHERLTRAGVQAQALTCEGHATITKLRVLSRHQQLLRLDFEDGFAKADHAQLYACFCAALPEADLVILSDYGKGTLDDVARLIEAARAAGKPILVDPKGADFSRYRGATAVTPNLVEFERIAGPCAGARELEVHAEQLRDQLELEVLLVTRSERGMMLVRRGHAPLHLPTQARDVYDVTGAGDTVIGVLGASLAAGLGFPEATWLANLAASVVVGKLGTATVSIPELEAVLRIHERLPQGSVSEAKLIDLVRQAQARGERVVMTNGCFDLLHAGHVAYLAQAARLGDRLIVAVNDDASVRRLKGVCRPINGLEARMAVLAALAGVDWVVSFAQDTPERLIKALGPDVLVKGGDYQPDEIVGADSVRARGGEVVVLDYVDGCSTSRLIEAIQQQAWRAP